MDGVALHLEVQSFQNPDHFLTGNIGAQQAVDLLRLQLHGDGVGVLGDDVHHALHHFAGAQQLHQLAGSLHGLHGVHGVKALFIAGGGVRPHIQRGGGAVDRGAVEVGGLKEDHGGIAHDLTVGTAHDARHAHGLVLVADAEHGGGQLPLVAVQRLNGLILLILNREKMKSDSLGILLHTEMCQKLQLSYLQSNLAFMIIRVVLSKQ